jgi:hypothetical protein
MDGFNNQNANYINYLAKDMFYFTSPQKTEFGILGILGKSIEEIYFCPEGFNLNAWKTANLLYRNSFDNSMSKELLVGQERNLRQTKYKYASVNSFWAN